MRFWCVCLSIALCFSMCGCVRKISVKPTDSTVLIDPGHGGFDGGAVAADGTLEKHINLAISLNLYDLLYVCGVPVSLTRCTDVGLNESDASTRSMKVEDMRKRLDMYQDASLVISIHQNKFTQPQYDGTQVF